MVEIIPKPIKKMPSWERILMYFTFGLLFVSIGSFFLLNYFVNQSKKELQKSEEVLNQIKTEKEIALEKEVFDYQVKIKDFSLILTEHFYSSKFFGFFEKLCHPQVWFSQMNFNVNDYNLSLSGETTDFLTLEQQLRIFRKEPLIKSIVLSDLSVGGEGLVDFSLDIILDQNIIK
ncbi:hypothetical protein KKA72_01590 [Patescibacteria group bacterium]|nr:hypothetical protein [Patescibacteria group bacterium]MBU1877024.1 hypothetical protein [Patescibacteria group bacterium]